MKSFSVIFLKVSVICHVLVFTCVHACVCAHLASQAFDGLLSVPVCVWGGGTAAAAHGALSRWIQLIALARGVTSSAPTCHTHTYTCTVTGTAVHYCQTVC